MSEDIQLFSSSHRTEQFRIGKASIRPGSAHKPWKQRLILLSHSQLYMECKEELFRSENQLSGIVHIDRKTLEQTKHYNHNEF